MDLCQYKDVFGKPGETVHSYRVFDIAIIDAILVMIIAVVIKVILDKHYPGISLGYILLAVFTTGILAHRIFCVRTTVDKLLFGQE